MKRENCPMRGRNYRCTGIQNISLLCMAGMDIKTAGAVLTIFVQTVKLQKSHPKRFDHITSHRRRWNVRNQYGKRVTENILIREERTKNKRKRLEKISDRRRRAGGHRFKSCIVHHKNRPSEALLPEGGLLYSAGFTLPPQGS